MTKTWYHGKGKITEIFFGDKWNVFILTKTKCNMETQHQNSQIVNLKNAHNLITGVHYLGIVQA